MDAGRRGKGIIIIIIWERAGRASSRSRGQRAPHLNSDHASQTSGGEKIGLFLGTQVRSYTRCCDLEMPQFTRLKVRLAKRIHSERTWNWRKRQVYKPIFFPTHFVFSLPFKKFAFLVYI